MHKKIFSEGYENFDHFFSLSSNQHFFSDDFQQKLPLEQQLCSQNEKDLEINEQFEDPELLQEPKHLLSREPQNDSILKTATEISLEIIQSHQESQSKPIVCHGKRKKKNSGLRKKDQNLCKRYNVLAHRALKKMGMNKIVSQYKALKHRQDYFLIMVILASKAEQLDSFKSIYRSEAKNLKNCCREKMKQTFKDSLEYKKMQSLLEAIERSFTCIELYEKNKLEQATQCLFDLKNLRNKNFVERSIEFVSSIQGQIRKP